MWWGAQLGFISLWEGDRTMHRVCISPPDRAHSLAVVDYPIQADLAKGYGLLFATTQSQQGITQK